MEPVQATLTLAVTGDVVAVCFVDGVRVSELMLVIISWWVKLGGLWGVAF